MAVKSAAAALCVLLFSSLLLTETTEAVVNCGAVAAKAAPCLGYIRGQVPKVPAACCGGLKQLAGSATTADVRRGICKCMQNGVKAVPGVQDRLLGQIPAICGIKVGFPVSLSINCDKIN